MPQSEREYLEQLLADGRKYRDEMAATAHTARARMIRLIGMDAVAKALTQDKRQ